MSNQDFSKRMVIVVRKDIEPWQTTNTIAHIAAYLGNKINTSFDTGISFVTKDGINLPRNSQYPFITKTASSSNDLHTLFEEIKTRNLLHIVFIREMIDHSDDSSLQKEVSLKNNEDLEYLGIGVFGDNEELKKLTKKFSLFS